MKLVLGAGLAGLIGYLTWAWLHPDESQVIRNRIQEMAALCRIEAQSTPLQRAAKAGKIRGFLRKDIEVNLHVPQGGVERIRGEDVISTVQAVLVNQNIRRLHLELLDVEVTVAPDGLTARSQVTAIAHLNEEEYWLAQEWDLRLIHSEGLWKIQSVDTLKEL